MDYDQIDVLRTSRCGYHFGMFLGCSLDVSPKLKEYVRSNYFENT